MIWRQTGLAVVHGLALIGAVTLAIARTILAGLALLYQWPRAAIFAVGLAAAGWGWVLSPIPVNDPLEMVAWHSPRLHLAFITWYYVAPATGVWLTGYVTLSVWRIWGQSKRRGASWGLLPPWPASPEDDSPSLVVGEIHHPVEPRQIDLPSWLTIPERGLYTGVAIFGAIGTGKTSACMYPFTKQLLSWQAHAEERRAAALVLEVKGDFCFQVQEILAAAGREEDYIEIGLDGRWRWNPLSSEALDSYSLAYTISSLLNQLFGKGKEPFWQQAYTNLCRWIIETHKMLPGGWVTLQDVYRCAIDGELLEATIRHAEAAAARTAGAPAVTILAEDYYRHFSDLGELVDWQQNGREVVAAWTPELGSVLEELQLPCTVDAGELTPGQRRAAAIRRWYDHDWGQLDNKLRSSIVEGVSVFLSMFDMPEIADVFCPPAPQNVDGSSAALDFPPIKDLIESGRVLALNMPAGANPALGRAVGVMLKNAWLQALLLRPAQMQADPERYFRPAVFVCDEYQQFATAGQDDPSGDEKSFALTRQSKCIPIVATQSVSSLRAVLGTSEAWRALLQTLRTRIFLSLSDDASTQLASNLCGEVERVKPSYGLSETSRSAGVSLLSGAVGSGKKDMAWSKNFALQWQALFQPRDFSRLENCQAICVPYDGAQTLEAIRVYLKPYYLPRELGYWQAKDQGKI